jgi:hypothetical protein
MDAMSTRRFTMPLVGALLAIVSMAAISGGQGLHEAASPTGDTSAIEDPTGPWRPMPGTPGIAGGIDVPESLAFADTSVRSSLSTIARAEAPVGVHSAPGRLYTELGRLRADERIGLTGYRVRVEDEDWAEIIWDDTTAWIPAIAVN